MNKKEVGEKIASAREKKGWTQTEMADRLGMTIRQYGKYESGNFPKFKTDVVREIDKLLGTKAYESIYELKVPHENDDLPEDVVLTNQELTLRIRHLHERNIHNEATIAVLKQTLENLLANSNGKSVALISAQLDEAIELTVKKQIAVLNKKAGF